MIKIIGMTLYGTVSRHKICYALHDLHAQPQRESQDLYVTHLTGLSPFSNDLWRPIIQLDSRTSIIRRSI